MTTYLHCEVGVVVGKCVDSRLGKRVNVCRYVTIRLVMCCFQ